MLKKRLKLIKDEMEIGNIECTHQNILKYFMTTLISDDLIRNIYNLSVYSLPSNTFTCPDGATNINKYIKEGKYILTLRANNLYIVRREFLYDTFSGIYVWNCKITTY